MILQDDSDVINFFAILKQIVMNNCAGEPYNLIWEMQMKLAAPVQHHSLGNRLACVLLWRLNFSLLHCMSYSGTVVVQLIKQSKSPKGLCSVSQEACIPCQTFDFNTGGVTSGVLRSDWSSPVKDMDMLGKVQQRVMKMMKELEHLSYEKSLRKLWLFNIEEEKIQWDLCN